MFILGTGSQAQVWCCNCRITCGNYCKVIWISILLVATAATFLFFKIVVMREVSNIKLFFLKLRNVWISKK